MVILCEHDSHLNFYDAQGELQFSLLYPAGVSVAYCGTAHSASKIVNPEALSHSSTNAAGSRRIMLRLTLQSGHGDTLRLPANAAEGAELVRGVVRMIEELGSRCVMSSSGRTGLGRICDEHGKVRYDIWTRRQRERGTMCV